MSIVTLDEVKEDLNITTATNDNELLGVLYDAIAAVEDVVGPLRPATVVEEIDSHGPKVVLSRTPVLSVESVSIEPWLGATAVDDTSAWRLNKATGVLRRMVVGGSLPFYGQGSVFTVTYTAGRTTVPEPVNRAIKMQVKDMWQSQRGSMPLPASSDVNPPLAYMGQAGFLGADVMELLRPYLPPPGVA